MSVNVQSFVIDNYNGPPIENGLNNVCLHPLSLAFTFTEILAAYIHLEYMKSDFARDILFSGITNADQQITR